MNLTRLALVVDAAGGLAGGLLLVAGGELVASLTGIPAAISMPLGLFLLALGAFIAWVAAQRETPRGPTMLIVLINCVWVIGSAIVLVPGVLPLTMFGVGFVIVQAVAVAALAAMQWIGLGRIGLRTTA
ncbi:hypothetical protein PRN20_15725 [Devosia sp. ZB163]|uniref:hypothetical protein n=1 Tax=Devosia sp. ZB163 TaxID=3025938 RepID=UPI00235FFD40|nr:hypothetical protein [Devosia sp. ZB163]MDC9825178.1 hypothetical protein [Devosia sp. ZB163]